MCACALVSCCMVLVKNCPLSDLNEHRCSQICTHSPLVITSLSSSIPFAHSALIPCKYEPRMPDVVMVLVIVEAGVDAETAIVVGVVVGVLVGVRVVVVGGRVLRSEYKRSETALNA